MKLIDRKPNRLFAFGCSFTEYHWATWPQVVAHDLDIPLYNLARCGSGNQLIANTFSQAIEKYNIDENDLVMICWSGFFREDRWIRGHWVLTGDITHCDFYNDAFIDTYVDPLGCYVRDFPLMSLTIRQLEAIGCQHHQMSMCSIWTPEQEFGELDPHDHIVQQLKSTFPHLVDTRIPSFQEDLWKNQMVAVKQYQEQHLFRCGYTDWHPTPEEQLEFLRNVFDEHQFSSDTDMQINRIQEDFVEYVRQTSSKFPNEFDLNQLPNQEFMQLFDRFELSKNLHQPGDLI